MFGDDILHTTFENEYCIITMSYQIVSWQELLFDSFSMRIAELLNVAFHKVFYPLRLFMSELTAQMHECMCSLNFHEPCLLVSLSNCATSLM